MDGEEDFSFRTLVFLVVAFIYWLIDRDHLISIDRPIFVIICFALAFTLAEVSVWVSRYYMPHVAVNGCVGSIMGRPVPVKDKNGLVWAVINLGASKYPVPLRGKLGTLVVPWYQLSTDGKKIEKMFLPYSGENLIGKILVRKWPLKGLPTQVYHYLVHNASDYNLKNVYYGRFTEDFISSNPNVPELELLAKDKSYLENLRIDIIEGRNDELTEMVEFGRKISGNKRSILDVFRPRPEEKEE